MGLTWIWVGMVLGVSWAQADRGGSSLRGALEVLQRRQRGRMHGPVLPQPDYDALYEFVPPQGYPEPDYPVDVENIEDEPNPKYIVKFLDENERSPPEAYEYKLIKKKNSHFHEANPNRQESPFRERAHHPNNDKLRDLFMDKTEMEDKKEPVVTDKDAEYAVLLGQLWSKYKYNKDHENNVESAPQGVVKLYKEKVVKKRYPDNWGPIAFKRKRSSDSEADRPIVPDYEERKHESGSSDSNYNTYELNDDDKDDLREEYAIAFQPLDDDTLSDLADDDQYIYDNVKKRFPITKRSSGSYDFGPKQRSQNQNKREALRPYSSSSGTDPRILKDLSKIFGNSEIEIIKNPVKRSSDHVEDHHEGKPPMVPLVHNNHTQEKNFTAILDDDSHEHHGHNIHHPGISGKELEVTHNHGYDHDQDHKQNFLDEHDNAPKEVTTEKPIILKKKSIDWSDYFGIDKRKPGAFGNDLTQDRLRKQYFDTFNKEVLYPMNSFRRHSYVKRNFVKAKPNEETEIQIDRAHAFAVQNAKRDIDDSYSKGDNVNNKLENIEEFIMADEGRPEIIPNEEHETKEKVLSRLAATYNLERTRKPWQESHTHVKRSFLTPRPLQETEMQIDRAQALAIRKNEKRSADDNESKLDNIDKKLKNMEGLIVDEALHFDNNGEELDSKEAQETKEKLLSRLAAAYSLEKMRKALKEFKQSLQTQKSEGQDVSPVPTDEAKTKRVAIKKELTNNEVPFSNQIIEKNDDFEDEQGAGHYLNGKVDEQFSEGYMGGSGRHRVPAVSTASAVGSCPVLAKIVQRCRGVDLLAGDRGQLFLPLCSLHQICYLCGEAPPTTCDLVFLSEADTACEGDMSCQRAARSALMALRELHDNLADELDGECELSPCLPATLKLNLGWQRALQR